LGMSERAYVGYVICTSSVPFVDSFQLHKNHALVCFVALSPQPNPASDHVTLLGLRFQPCFGLCSPFVLLMLEAACLFSSSSSSSSSFQMKIL
jgi:hypothetical protein